VNLRHALAALIAASIGASGAQVRAGQSAAPAWPQARSDLKADPAVRFGTLPNGMRYAIMKNATPEKQVSLRLRIGSGSLEESDAQQGLAHFLEHMAFRGSKSVADGEVKKSLERLGLQMGADTNAFTAQTQTVYKFDLARNDAASIDRGLLLMRETCNELTLDAKTFATERGVVLSEYRLSDTPTRHWRDELLAFSMPKQLASERLPIGKKTILDTATVAVLRDYYRKWYRPERATFIVTGDVDIDAMEARIRSRFGDWKSATPSVRDPDLGRPAVRGAEARVFTQAGVPSVAELEWVTPYDASLDSRARERRELIRQVGFAVLNRRLQAAAAAADREFSQAGVAHNAFAYSSEITTLFVAYDADAWRPALLAAENLRRQAVEGGVQQEEVDREVAALRAHFKTAAAGAATRTTPRLADDLVSSVDRNEVFSSPEQDMEETEAVFAGLTVANVNEGLRAAFSAGGPVAMIANPNAIAQGDSAALAALTQAERGSVVAAAAVEKQAWPYTSFGPEGAVAERKHLDDLDVTQVRFANGVRLNIKPTKYRADQVLVCVNIAGGRARMPTDRPSLEWADSAVVLGGTGKLDYQGHSAAGPGGLCD
jgi:zinc protease